MINPEKQVEAEVEFPNEGEDFTEDLDGSNESDSNESEYSSESSDEVASSQSNVFGNISSFGGSFNDNNTSSNPQDDELQGILQFGDEKMAIIGGNLVFKGDQFGSSWVKSINKKTVVIRTGSNHKVLRFVSKKPKPAKSNSSSDTTQSQSGQPST